MFGAEVSLRPRNPTTRYSVLVHDLIMRVKQLGVGKRRSRLSIASLTAEEIRFDGCLDSSNCRLVENVGRDGRWLASGGGTSGTT